MFVRPLFYPGNPQVAIKPIPYGLDNSIPAGTDVSDLPEYQLRSFWRRFLIGEKDHEWTNWMLEMAGVKPPASEQTNKRNTRRRKSNGTSRNASSTA